MECQRFGRFDHIHARVDNRTAVAQINKMGSPRSAALLRVTKDLWDFCSPRQITITAEYLPGRDNVTADRQSRVFTSSSQWKLDKGVFQMLRQRWGPLDIHLFASRVTAQLDRYVSCRPSRGCVHIELELICSRLFA